MGNVADWGRRLEVGCAPGCVGDGGDGEGAVGGEDEGDVGREPVQEGRAGVVAKDILVNHEEDCAGRIGGAEDGGDGGWVCGLCGGYVRESGELGAVMRDIPGRGISSPAGMTELVP